MRRLILALIGATAMLAGASLAPTGAAGAAAPMATVAITRTSGYVASVAMASTPGGGGYWVTGLDGGVFAFGNAGFYGSVPGAIGHRPLWPVEEIASTRSGNGYWLAGADGGVYSFGDAGFFGSVPGSLGQAPSSTIVAFAATPSGKGYWMLGADGGLYAFGDAGFYGSLPGSGINVGNFAYPCTTDRTSCVVSGGIVSLAPTPTGNGYWMADANGGVYAFGDARFFGSVIGALGHSSGRPVRSIAGTPDGQGYWLISDEGGVYAFGDAKYLGSLPGSGVMVPAATLTKGATGDAFMAHIPLSSANQIVPTPSGKGYWLASLDGGVFAFGDAKYLGSVPGTGATVQGVEQTCGVYPPVPC